MARAKKWLAGRSGAIAISESGGVRMLHIGGDAIQSAMRLSAPDALELDYTRAMMAFLLFHPEPRDVLMVGLGGGSIARFMHARMPGTRVAVVEIDAGVIAAARHYFGLPPEDARLRVVLGDGAEYVPAHPASADVLILDGFEDGAHASELCTLGFYEAARGALREGGVLVANFMSDDRKLDVWCGRMRKSFGGRLLRVSAEDGVNLIVLAFNGGPARVAWGELSERARRLERAFGLPFERFVASLKKYNRHTTRYLRIAGE